FSSRRRHTRFSRDWSSDVCSSDLTQHQLGIAGGTASNTKLVLGSGRMIPGFEDGLVGAKAGESRTVSVTFPEDYQNLDLAGKARSEERRVGKERRSRVAASE